jgi:transposase
MHTAPFWGVVYVFRAKRADRVKLIFSDGSGVMRYLPHRVSEGP